MMNSKVKTKKGYLLRKLGKEYMIVAIGKASEEFNGMIRVNESGAFIWKQLQSYTTEKELLEKAMEHFEDCKKEQLQQDIHAFLSTVSFALEVKD